MKRLIFALMVIALLVPAAVAFATAEGPGEPPDPNCKWVEPTTHQKWVPPVTEIVIVVDKEAYDETIKGTCYPAETHEETVVDAEGYWKTVVDAEAYDEVIKGTCYPEVSHQEYVPPVTHEVYHPAVTHEECTDTYSCPTFTWPKQTYYTGPWWNRVKHEFGPITFTYDKSSDPNKCHRPTGSSLGVPSELMSDFNHDFDKHKCSTKKTTCETVVDKEAWTEIVIDVAGYWKTVVDKEAYCDPDTTVHHDAVTHQEWVPPVTHIITVVDKEAYCDPDTIIHHDAETHEETVVLEEGYWKTVTDTEGYWDCPDMCQYNTRILATDPACKPAKECKWEGTGVGVFELWSGPDYTGDYALMYVYDFGDGLPEGVATFRQECVLGWVAQTDTGPWEITRNTCTGQLSWHGLKFTPSEKVIREKTCDRSQPCLVQ